MEQFEQLLTCAICLDRYRNPKLLPCQHSFCMEPCMDGLVDYVRRQVKCPECRAEHRIPYQGVQGYPTNVTLQRFLELHIEITGEMPDPTSGQIMKRCAVCTEKAYCSHCNHCTKDVCPQCKTAHMDILRREISRINNQVRRAMHRLEDLLAMVEKNIQALQVNCSSVSEEVDEIYRRLSKALKDRTDYLRGEVDRYLSVELRNLGALKDNLELEVSNIQANCDLADKHMQSEDVEWEDIELLDTKEIFLKTVDFIRNFEAEMGDYTRRVRFSMTHDPNQLVMHVSTYGDLNISMPHQFAMSAQQIQPGARRTATDTMLNVYGPGLMRSKSDHRLAAQYRQQDRDYDRDERATSPLNGRRFGDKYPQRRQERSEYDYGGEYEESRPARSRIRSRFRHGGDNTDSDNDTSGGGRNVRFSEGQKERERVLDTEDVAKGPLSGITRLYDSPRVMKRLQDSETKKDRPPAPAPQPPPPTTKFQPPKRPTPPVAQRQVSEEDEIAKIKKLMKNAPGEPRDATSDRVANLRREDSERTSPANQRGASVAPIAPAETPAPKPTTPSAAAASSSEESDDSPPASLSQSSGTQRKPSVTRQSSAQAGSRRSSASSDVSSSATGHTKNQRSNSVESTASAESVPSPKPTGAAFTTEEVKQMLARHSPGSQNTSGSQPTPSSSSPAEPRRFHSRFLKGGSRAVTSTATKEPTHEEEDEDETSSSEDESSSEESDSDEETPVKAAEMAKTDIGPLLARSANARKSSKDETTYTQPSRTPVTTTTTSNTSYGSSSRQDDPSPAPWRSRTGAGSSSTTAADDDSSSRSHGGFTSRFLNKSRSSAAVSPDEEEPSLGRRYSTSGRGADSSSITPQTPKSRYAALKGSNDVLQDRKSRLARSKSTHNLGDDDDDEDVVAANSPAAYLASKFGTDLSRSRSSHAIKSREPSPDRSLSTARLRDIPSRGERATTPLRNTSASGASSLGGGSSSAGVGEKDGAALSSWARYLKNKYGARGKEGAGTSTISNSRRLSLGLPLRPENDEDQKNSPASPTSPTQHPLHQGFAVGSSTRGQYAAKRRQVFSVGSRGSEPGYFTWPRGVATGPDNSIVVADSSNHRVQVFDSNGIFQKEFGTYGNNEGEFDCLAGIAVNRIGQFIIADRYNHRIQVMDPSGRFLRAFGSQGTSDGKFNYPWGITTDALGFIYVCDKENHRVQVFQSDGTFVGKFGSHGSKIGQLDHPHYIAVSNTNKVIVSDSNNHRLQVFDVNGRVLSSFGQEGSEEGQFKFPRDESSSPSTSGSRPYQRSFSDSAASSSSLPEPSMSSEPQFSSQQRPSLNRSLSLTTPRHVTTHTHDPSSTLRSSSALSGSSGGRSGIHPGGGLGEQQDTNLHSRGGIYPGLRLLGERRGGVQGVGGGGSHVQFQHPRLRPGKPQNPSLLRRVPGTSNVHVFDPLVSKRIMMEATVSLPPYRSTTTLPTVGYSPSITAALIAQRRTSLS